MEQKESSASKVGTSLRKRMKFALILGLPFLLLLLGAIIIWQLPVGPRLCSVCHEMKPETVTWQASSHNRIPCTACHKPNYYQMISQDLGQKYLLPIEVTQPFTDELCNQCHDMKNRVVTPSGDIKMSHTKHLAQNIPCIQCHSGVVHADIVNRQITIDGKFTNWTTAMGKAQMNARFTEPKMQLCQDCHQENNVKLSCDACHTKIVLPENHKQTTWLKGQHGQEAKQNLAECDYCHSYTKQNLNISGLDAVTEYARTNTFCYECHSKAPPGHDAAWGQTHGNKAKGAGREDCLVCHSANKPKPTDNVTKTYCQQCHQDKHSNFDRASHPIPLPEDTRPQKSCISCHPASKCATCHVISG